MRGLNSLHIFPWAHWGCNTWSNKDQLQKVTFPDIEPSGLDDDSNFSMAAGDFLEVCLSNNIHTLDSYRNCTFQIYTEPEAWDCIATCFFIDCANNIVSFIETINKILKPGKQYQLYILCHYIILDTFRGLLDQFRTFVISFC